MTRLSLKSGGFSKRTKRLFIEGCGVCFVLAVLVGLHGYLCWLKLGDDRDREGTLSPSGEAETERPAGEKHQADQLNIIY